MLSKIGTRFRSLRCDLVVFFEQKKGKMNMKTMGSLLMMLMEKNRMTEKRRWQTVMRRDKRRRKGRKGIIHSLLVLPLVLVSSWLPALILVFPPSFRDSEKHYELDEDDYELLQDNNITGFHRPKLVSLLPFYLYFVELNKDCILISMGICC